MEEYFCPNCGAILNEQYGFDSSCGTWTCTSCGKLLMDDDVYEGNSYEGVAWFCDGCGTLLNRQEGFTDSNNSWICTECGYLNEITEENIIDNTFLCPNCGENLNEQSGFNKYSNDYQCSVCGAKLHRDFNDINYSIVEDKWICPNCGANLEKQDDFSDIEDDWQCTECGTKLHHDFNNEEYSIVNNELICPNCTANLEEQDGFLYGEEYWECTECGEKLYYDFGDEAYNIVEEDLNCPNCGTNLEEQDDFSYVEDYYKCSICGARLHHYCSALYEIVEEDDYDKGKNNNNNGDEMYKYHEKSSNKSTFNKTSSQHQSNKKSKIKNEKKISKGEFRKQRIKSFLFKQKKIRLKYGCSDLVGENIHDVETILYNQALNNIKSVPIKDIYVGSQYRVDQVEQVIIDGHSNFKKGDKISYDAEIILTYHEKIEISLPYDEKEFQKMDYLIAKNKLKKLGFTEIYENPLKDLVTGWIKKDGSVEKIIINNIYPFKQNDIFKYDAKIIINYHSFKRK